MPADINENGIPDNVDKAISGVLLLTDAAFSAFLAATSSTYDWAPWVFGVKAMLPILAGYFMIKGRP